MSPVKEFFMVSPCGYKHGEFTAMNAPAGWTDCSDLSDAEVTQLIARRSEATWRANRDEYLEDKAEQRKWHRDFDSL